MSVSQPRPARLVAEEIEDLTRYLDGLPKEARETEAFAVYHERLRLLREELQAARAETHAKVALENADPRVVQLCVESWLHDLHAMVHRLDVISDELLKEVTDTRGCSFHREQMQDLLFQVGSRFPRQWRHRAAEIETLAPLTTALDAVAEALNEHVRQFEIIAREAAPGDRIDRAFRRAVEDISRARQQLWRATEDVQRNLCLA